MPIIGWIRDLLGIHKDHIDKQKSRLEVKKLEKEESEGKNLIKPATLDDVKKYDPKAARLEYEHRQQMRRYEEERRYKAQDKRIHGWGREGKISKDGGCLVTLLLILLLTAVFMLSV